MTYQTNSCGAHRNRRHILVAVFSLVLGVVQVTNGHGSTAMAVGSYQNSAIADLALRYVVNSGDRAYARPGHVAGWGGNACIDAGRSGATGGSPGGQVGDGQCRAFVNCIVWMASGGTQWIGGGSDAFVNIARYGTQITDINQLIKGDVVQKYVSSSDLHTFIIVSRVSGSTFNVVDSNYSTTNDELVRYHTYTVTLSSTMRAYRLGLGSPDSDRDGIADSADACPSVAGGQSNGCPVPNTADTLVPGETVATNGGIYSPNGLFVLIMQGDGNLVLYRNWPGGGAAWASATAGSGSGNWAVMQSDGNFVVYTSASRAVWSSGTGQPGSYLRVQDDGNVVIYSATGVKWATNTSMALPFPAGGRWYEVKNLNSGLCVDARGGSTSNGTVIQQYYCNGTAAQRYLFVHVGGGYFQILRMNAGSQSLDVKDVSGANGALIQTWTYVGGGNQKWFPQKLGANSWRFIAQHSGKCIDVPGASRSSGQSLQQYTCNGTAAQSFALN